MFFLISFKVFVEMAKIAHHLGMQYQRLCINRHQLRLAYVLSGRPVPDRKSREYCCHNSLPPVINPDYNMIKWFCVKRIHNKIRSKSPSNRATSNTFFHCGATHLSLATGIVALHIPLRRARAENPQSLPFPVQMFFKSEEYPGILYYSVYFITS